MYNRIIESLVTFADEFPNKTALSGENEALSYKELLLRAFNIADWFEQTHASRIGLYRENSIEWIILDLAALIAKVTLVPIPSFFSDQQIKHLIADAALDFVLCDDANRFKKIEPCFLDDGMIIGNKAVLRYSPKRDRGRVQAQNLAKITFTSGTTGHPKGVCLSFDTLDKVAFSLVDILSRLSIPSHINLLPLSTLLENVAGVYVPLIMGKQIQVYSGRLLGFLGSSGLDACRLIRQLNRTRPGSFILLPQMLSALLMEIERNGPLSYTPSFIALGGSKISPKLITKARSFGLPVYEGYGLSESGSVVSLNSPSGDYIGSVGKPLPHVQIKIENDTIFVKGANFSGYLGSEGNDHEWIDTGDYGRFDSNGFLFVTGRKKNVLVSSFGRNISPEWVESEFTKSSWIAQCAVFGDALPFCSAIFVPRDLKFKENQMFQFVEHVNANLPDYARIKRWIIAREPFTTENGLLTVNGQARRDRILARYQLQIEELYRSLDPLELRHQVLISDKVSTERR